MEQSQPGPERSLSSPTSPLAFIAMRQCKMTIKAHSQIFSPQSANSVVSLFHKYLSSILHNTMSTHVHFLLFNIYIYPFLPTNLLLGNGKTLVPRKQCNMRWREDSLRVASWVIVQQPREIQACPGSCTPKHKGQH